jgi:hypothetical protein
VRHSRTTSLACGVLVLAISAFAQQTVPAEPSPTAPSPSPQAAAASTGSLEIAHFDDKPCALESLFSKMLELEKAGDASGVQEYVRSLEVPDSKAWFTNVFGDSVGAEFSRAYESLRPRDSFNATF